MLPNINLIYLSAHVLIIMDSTYFSRFWTLFEAWLSMQSVSAKGLLPASEKDQRSTIKCIHNASMEFDGKKLRATWKSKTPKEAHSVLSANDIQVTNQSDKTDQLKKLLKLNEFAVSQYAAFKNAFKNDKLSA